jgi:hypothetical protein
MLGDHCNNHVHNNGRTEERRFLMVRAKGLYIGLLNDRPDLSSERAPQIGQDCNFQRKKKYLWSKVPDLARHQDLLTDCQL